MRTQDEIVARYEAKKGEDFLGVIANDLIPYLDFERARPYLKDGAQESEWNPWELTEESVRTELINYLPFAREKAEGERGISAGRSIQHFASWLWLLGDDELLAFAEDDDNYAPYGMPVIERIAEKYAT